MTGPLTWFYRALAPDVLAMSAAERSHRRRLMLRLGVGGACLGIVAGAVLGFFSGHSAVGGAIGGALGQGAFGLMWGHLESTANPPHPWFAPKH